MERSQAQSWRARDVARVAIVATLAVSVLGALWYALDLLLFCFLGVLFGLALSRGVDWLARWRIPRGIGAGVLMLAILGGVGGLGALTAPTLIDQGHELRTQLPAAMKKIQSWVRARAGTIDSITLTPQPPAPKKAQPESGGGTQARMGALVERIFGFLGSTVEVIVYVLLVLFLSVYIATKPDLYYQGVLHLIPRDARKRAGEVMAAMSAVLRRWLLTQLIAMVTIGVAWAIALSLLHVKAALALATIAGILEFVPTIGPTIAAIPAVLAGVLDSPQKGLEVLAVYLLIQGLESNILIPMLMDRQIDLPPGLTIVVQALMALAAGFIGLMVAVPLLAAALVAVKMLYVRDVIGDSVGLGRAAEQAAEAG